jgi:hypothetical protein
MRPDRQSVPHRDRRHEDCAFHGGGARFSWPQPVAKRLQSSVPPYRTSPVTGRRTRPLPAATLHEVTGGNPAPQRPGRSSSPLGHDDERRAVARTRAVTLGGFALIRAKGRPSFSPHETALVASLSEPIGEALPSRWLRPTTPRPAPQGQAFVMVGSHRGYRVIQRRGRGVTRRALLEPGGPEAADPSGGPWSESTAV